MTLQKRQSNAYNLVTLQSSPFDTPPHTHSHSHSCTEANSWAAVRPQGPRVLWFASVIFPLITTCSMVSVAWLIFLYPQDLKPGNLAVNQDCELKVSAPKDYKTWQNFCSSRVNGDAGCEICNKQILPRAVGTWTAWRVCVCETLHVTLAPIRRWGSLNLFSMRILECCIEKFGGEKF